ncbi:hypothetical protein OAU97_00070 [bacterium]|jgi:hypothetical protein|nr:hypothetical protein [bacterium]|tara:strand:- start:38 stop:667 length:630 start_codon:yes stop_codon:yes gene_type:complete
MLSSGDSWDGVLLTSPEEVIDGEIPAVEENIEIAVERAIQASRGFDTAVQLVFGIDPGPRPGLAWLADGIIVGSAQLESVNIVADHIIALSTAVVHKRMSVKVGDGAPLIRDRIINQLILRGIETLEVSEHRTSSGSRSKAHINAATRIALVSGTKVNQIRVLRPTDGDLREIQRQSRIFSSGEITIPTELARMVVCGEISMEEAIKKA